MRGLEIPVKTITSKTSYFRPVRSFHDKPPAGKKLLRQVSASHEKFPSRLRQPARSRALSVFDQDTVHTMWHHPGAWASPLRRMGREFPMPCKYTSWRRARAAGSDKSRNVALLSCTALNTLSHLALRHANSDRGTRVPPTISRGLRLGLNVAHSSRTQAG
jgi:hypothetical protein